MLRVVLDTNVLISAAITANGKSHKIVRMVLKGILAVYYSSDILNEYVEVFARPKFSHFFNDGTELIWSIKTIGNIVAPIASKIALPDESDRFFYDVANYAEAMLVTGNIKHFPQESFIVTPSTFLVRIGME